MSNGGGPSDHPGEYRWIAIKGQSAEQLRVASDQAEADGFDFKALNEAYAVFYKEKHESH